MKELKATIPTDYQHYSFKHFKCNTCGELTQAETTHFGECFLSCVHCGRLTVHTCTCNWEQRVSYTLFGTLLSKSSKIIELGHFAGWQNEKMQESIKERMEMYKQYDDEWQLRVQKNIVTFAAEDV